jgi:hypothetical protein
VKRKVSKRQWQRRRAERLRRLNNEIARLQGKVVELTTLLNDSQDRAARYHRQWQSAVTDLLDALKVTSPHGFIVTTNGDVYAVPYPTGP